MALDFRAQWLWNSARVVLNRRVFQLENAARKEPLDRVLRPAGFTREIYLTTRPAPLYLRE
jgi:hypothetical protein